MDYNPMNKIEIHDTNNNRICKCEEKEVFPYSRPLMNKWRQNKEIRKSQFDNHQSNN